MNCLHTVNLVYILSMDVNGDPWYIEFIKQRATAKEVSMNNIFEALSVRFLATPSLDLTRAFRVVEGANWEASQALRAQAMRASAQAEEMHKGLKAIRVSRIRWDWMALDAKVQWAFARKAWIAYWTQYHQSASLWKVRKAAKASGWSY